MYRLKNGGTLIDDTYNANPASVAVALKTLQGLKGECRSTVILGDMLELGSEAEKYHEEIGRSLAELLAYSTHTAFARRWTRLWLRAASGEAARVEAKLPLRSGRRLIALISMRLFRFEQDEFATIVITETHQARAAARGARANDARTRALAEHQQANDAVMALATLKEAFVTDVTPILAMARQRAGGPIEPIAAYRASGYRAEKTKERGGRADLG